MKRRLIIPIVCLMLAVNLTACKNNEDPQNRTEFPIYKDAVFDTNRKSLLRHISAEKGLK